MNYQDFYCINSCILDATNPHEGYVSKDGMIAAVRCGDKEYMIIRNGKQDKLCKDWETAMKYVSKVEKSSKKSRSKAALKID